MKPILKYKTPYLYLTGLILLVAGLPVSLFLTSLSQFFLAGSFLLEGNVSAKFKRFSANKVAVLLAGIWLMHLIGLFWTSDLAEGLKDLRIKLPILILPLIVAGSEPLSEKQFKGILSAFIAAVFIGSMSAIFVLTGIIHREIYDIRDVFIFHISHIRFALFTCVAISIIIYYIFYKKALKGFLKVSGLLLIAWFIIFLFIVQSLTGLITITIVCIGILFHYLLRSKSKIYKTAFVIILIAIPISIGVYVDHVVQNYSVRKNFPVDITEKTANGNAYEFFPEESQMENGYPIYMYLCTPELRKSWNERSALQYDSLDKRNQPLYSTLIRFLTSKGLKKDSAAVYSLSTKEVKSIEEGIANVDFQNKSDINVRIKQVVWEVGVMLNGGNPSGHSVTQRLEFWRAASGIIAAHPFFGVGTGDLVAAYQNQYVLMKSQLDKSHRLRSHNQYLSIAAGFGIIGLIYFLIALFSPMFFKRKISPLFVFYFLICIVSMLTEDTLETQPGATFVGFFFIFFYIHSFLPEGNSKK